MRTYVYIRDDDVYSLETDFLSFFNLFKDCHIPVIYGIIPGLLEKDLIQFLNVEKTKIKNYLILSSMAGSTKIIAGI